MADVPTTDLDETLPAGGRKINLGDNDIRAYKGQVRQVMEVDHDFPSSGKSETVGQHKQVTLQEQADLGTGAVSATILGSQTIDGKGELVYTDEDDNDVQLTDNGVIAGITAAVVNALVYPVGSVYTNAAVATNPATLLGVGTWVAIEGECVVGLKAGGTFDTLGTVSEGEETHKLTGGESGVAVHNHTTQSNTAYVWRKNSNTSGEGSYADSYSIQLLDAAVEANADDFHNNIQPSYVCYVWRRTA